MPRGGQPWDADFATKSVWFRPFEALLERFAGRADWPGPDEFTRLFEERRAAIAPELLPLVFVGTPPKSRRRRRRAPELTELYDGRIHLKREVPCLVASYHDLWNAVVFAAFPRAKHALHARQFRILERVVAASASRLPERRTREQDALTIFDEGGSIVCLSHALRDRFDDTRTCGEETALDLTEVREDEARVVFFGHALLEHMHEEPRTLRSSALVFSFDSGRAASLDEIDRLVCARLDEPGSFTSPGADAILELGRDGSVRLGPARPRETDRAKRALPPS